MLVLLTGAASAQDELTSWDFFGWLIEQLRLFFEWLGWIFGQLFSAIGDFFSGLVWIVQQIMNWFGDVFEFIWNVFSGLFEWIFNNILRPVWEFLVSAVRYVIEFVEIVALLIGLLIGFIGLALRWIWSVGVLVFQILNTLSNASPIPLPGLPLCVSAPVEHDLCAIWYIAEHTIFAHNTISDISLIIIVLMIDLWIIFYASKTISRISNSLRQLL